MKISLIAAVAASLLFVHSAPVAAQSANYWRNQQERTDPGYNQGPGEGRYNTGRYDAYAYDGGYYYQPVLPCFLFTCLIDNGDKRKPKNGEIVTLKDGTAVSYDKALNRWIPVGQPVATPQAAPAATAYTGTTRQQYMENGYLVTVTPTANGGKTVTYELIRH